MFLYKSIDKYIDEFEKKRDKYEYEYQCGGSSSSKRTSEKYDDLVQICIAAKENELEEDKTRMHIRKNVRAHIEKIEDRKMYARNKQYSLDELLEELHKIERLI